MRILCNQSF